MPRVKIKCRGPVNREKKVKLLEILCSNEIHVTKIFSATDGFAVLPLNEEHADSIVSREVMEVPERNGFSTNMPTKLKVKKECHQYESG